MTPARTGPVRDVAAELDELAGRLHAGVVREDGEQWPVEVAVEVARLAAAEMRRIADRLRATVADHVYQHREGAAS